MTGTPLLNTTFMPTYKEMFAVQAAASRFHYTSGQRYVSWLLLVPYFLMLGALIYWAAEIDTFLKSAVGDEAAFLLPIAAIVAVGIGCVWWMRRTAVRLSARWLEQRKPALVTSVKIDDSGLEWTSEESRTWVKWSGLERLFLIQDAVCFLFGGVTLFVPKRLFADEAAVSGFVERALVHLAPEARAVSEADPAVKAAVAVARANS